MAEKLLSTNEWILETDAGKNMFKRPTTTKEATKKGFTPSQIAKAKADVEVWNELDRKRQQSQMKMAKKGSKNLYTAFRRSKKVLEMAGEKITPERELNPLKENCVRTRTGKGSIYPEDIYNKEEKLKVSTEPKGLSKEEMINKIYEKNGGSLKILKSLSDKEILEEYNRLY